MIARLLAAALFTAALAVPALADEISTYVADGYAIGGTDPVTYFTDGEPNQGSDEFTGEYNGVTWRFVSAENRDAFLADPEKYAPAYGGFCATGMSFGQKIPIDPTYWKIVDGKLYLNNSSAAQRVFLEDEAGTISRADGHWAEIEDVPANRL
jgi:YHS domain-containing protein